MLDRLREMYPIEEQADIFDRVKPFYSIGLTLASHLFEVDAELALERRYPEQGKDRAKYYIKLQEREIGRWRTRSPRHPAPEYCVLRDQLCAELASILAHDDRVTDRLCNRAVEQLSDTARVEIATLHTKLSPTCNDYAELARWGAARHEEVVRRVTETGWQCV